MIRLTGLFDTRNLYTELLAKYKTIGSKKAFMTRDIKAQEAFIADVEEAVNREHSTGWYLGEKYNKFHLAHYRRELDLMKRIRTELSVPVSMVA